MGPLAAIGMGLAGTFAGFYIIFGVVGPLTQEVEGWWVFPLFATTFVAIIFFATILWVFVLMTITQGLAA